MYMNQNDVLYVVNFWATWCKPCIEELPYFMAIQKKYANNPHFKLILVSLDNASAFETQLSQFIKQRNINLKGQNSSIKKPLIAQNQCL